MSLEVLTICERQLEDNPMRVDENLHEKGAKVATNSPDASIRSTPAMLRDRGIGAFLVSTSTNPVSGIQSERDIVRAVAARVSTPKLSIRV